MIPVQTGLDVIYRVFSSNNPDYFALLLTAYITIVTLVLVMTSILLTKQQIRFTNPSLVLCFGLSIIAGGVIRNLIFHFMYGNQFNYLEEIFFYTLYWLLCFIISALAVGISNILTPEKNKPKKDTKILDN